MTKMIHIITDPENRPGLRHPGPWPQISILQYNPDPECGQPYGIAKNATLKEKKLKKSLNELTTKNKKKDK